MEDAILPSLFLALALVPILVLIWPLISVVIWLSARLAHLRRLCFLLVVLLSNDVEHLLVLLLL